MHSSWILLILYPIQPLPTFISPSLFCRFVSLLLFCYVHSFVSYFFRFQLKVKSLKRQPTPVLLPGESHRPRRLAGYSPWGCKESDMTEQTCMYTSEKIKYLFLSDLFHLAQHPQAPSMLLQMAAFSLSPFTLLYGWVAFYCVCVPHLYHSPVGGHLPLLLLLLSCFTHVQLFEPLWTVAHQSPLSMRFSW